jgi:16S rRNA (cytosine1402-N4)-methyltransferase
MATAYQHTSVLAAEVLELLNPQPNQNFIDCTLGGGGHTKLILEKTSPRGKVLAFELDERAIRAARANLKEYQDRLIIVKRNFVHLQDELKKQQDFNKISGIMVDLGLSSDQLLASNRGFSFRDEGPLDMRFDTINQTLTATDIILTWPEADLIKIFREYGEINQAARLAKGLVSWRDDFVKQKQNCLQTTMLVGAILRILNIKPVNLKRYRIHPATKIFQSLRIAVNQELANLEKFLPQAVEALSLEGRLAVISFHSLEDRLVKRYFRELATDCLCPPHLPVCRCHHRARVKLLTKRGLKPTPPEVKNNPRSRSAILRAVAKIS